MWKMKMMLEIPKFQQQNWNWLLFIHLTQLRNSGISFKPWEEHEFSGDRFFITYGWAPTGVTRWFRASAAITHVLKV